MIWQAPNTLINAFLEAGVSSLVGTVSVTLVDTDGTPVVAETTANIIEIAAGTYRAEIPGTGLAEDEYLIVWKHFNGAEVATEELVITGNATQLAIGSGTNYVTLAEVKAARDMSAYTYADDDILRSIAAASRAIDQSCRRRFYADADATSVRYYSPDRCDAVFIDDAVQVASVIVDTVNNGTYDYTWPSTDYSLYPLNAAADGEPYTQLKRRRYASRHFPEGEARVKVTGQFGWPSVPDPIAQATVILAARYLTRTREATFGVLVVAGGVESMRISRTDPDVFDLIKPFMRNAPLF